MRKPQRTLLVGVFLGGLALFPALAPAPQELARPKVGELKDLADQRVKVCERMLDYYRESQKAPPAPGDQLSDSARYAAGYEPIQLWSDRLLDARLDGSADRKGRIKVLAAEVDRLKKLEAEILAVAANQAEWVIAARRIEFYRLQAEFRLARERSSR